VARARARHPQRSKSEQARAAAIYAALPDSVKLDARDYSLLGAQRWTRSS
jgi:hypothetical protein